MRSSVCRGHSAASGSSRRSTGRGGPGTVPARKPGAELRTARLEHVAAQNGEEVRVHRLQVWGGVPAVEAAEPAVVGRLREDEDGETPEEGPVMVPAIVRRRQYGVGFGAASVVGLGSPIESVAEAQGTCECARERLARGDGVSDGEEPGPHQPGRDHVGDIEAMVEISAEGEVKLVERVVAAGRHDALAARKEKRA